jgi:hypothetical protein
MAKTITVMGTGGGVFVMDVTPGVEERIASGALTVVAGVDKDVSGESKPLGKMNHDELAAVMAAEGIDKGEASTKKEIVAVIEAAHTAKPDKEKGV